MYVKMKIPKHRTPNMATQKSLLDLKRGSSIGIIRVKTILDKRNPKTGSYTAAPIDAISPTNASHFGL